MPPAPPPSTTASAALPGGQGAASPGSSPGNAPGVATTPAPAAGGATAAAPSLAALQGTADQAPLIASIARPSLEQALQRKLDGRVARCGRHGELEALGLRLGLMQGTLRPRLRQPQLLVFAGDHGLALDVAPPEAPSTTAQVADLIESRVPLSVFAHQQGLHLNLVDCGLATPLAGRPGVLLRKIAHGTRNSRVAQAMSLDQVNAAIRAGMEITDTLAGNALGCAGLGLGGREAAALVIARLSRLTLDEMLHPGPDAGDEELAAHAARLVHLQAAQARHAAVEDPVEVLAAFGGFEIAMMVGAMLAAAHKRHLIMVDGMAACAALLVATRIGGPLPDYCVFCRSTTHAGLDRVLGAFEATALLELGLDALDGTGITLTWPLIAAAASLLGDVNDQADGLHLPVLTDPAVAVPASGLGATADTAPDDEPDADSTQPGGPSTLPDPGLDDTGLATTPGSKAPLAL